MALGSQNQSFRDETYQHVLFTPDSATGRNGGSSSFIPSQAFVNHRDRPSDRDVGQGRIRGGQDHYQGTLSVSQSNGVTLAPDQSADSVANPRSTPSPPALASSGGIPSARYPEFFTLHFPNGDQPTANSTRYTLWENVIEMPSNVPYDSLSGMWYMVTSHSRVSQVDVPNEGEEHNYDGEDGNVIDDMTGGSSEA
ncbi:hypothetical protein DL93DRAFT_2157237 [Clavulina sp. PMI_390]|nr:hypothetical protein DL93DRAFT_2157237 [Clavulina sp. PMI_390]